VILINGKKCVLASTLLLATISMQSATANIAGGTSAESALFSVTHVGENDNLNVRAGAGVKNEIVTTIPFDGGAIELLGDKITLGKTHWVLIKWKGITGWVSKYYLDADQSVNIESTKVATVDLAAADKVDATVKVAETKEQPTASDDKEERVSSTTEQEKTITKVTESKEDKTEVTEAELAPQPQEEWVLRCGNKSPYWKVDIHPKWMDVLKGDYETDLPITKKKQDRNRWNTALKTVVHGKNGRNNLQMTIKYAYSKRCYDTLSGLRVPYKVVTKFNGEELTGCCRAVKVALPTKDKSSTTKVSMK